MNTPESKITIRWVKTTPEQLDRFAEKAREHHNNPAGDYQLIDIIGIRRSSVFYRVNVRIAMQASSDFLGRDPQPVPVRGVRGRALPLIPDFYTNLNGALDGITQDEYAFLLYGHGKLEADEYTKARELFISQTNKRLYSANPKSLILPSYGMMIIDDEEDNKATNQVKDILNDIEDFLS